MLVYGSMESVFQQNESYDSDYSLEIWNSQCMEIFLFSARYIVFSIKQIIFTCTSKYVKFFSR